MSVSPWSWDTPWQDALRNTYAPGRESAGTLSGGRDTRSHRELVYGKNPPIVP